MPLPSSLRHRADSYCPASGLYGLYRAIRCSQPLSGPGIGRHPRDLDSSGCADLLCMPSLIAAHEIRLCGRRWRLSSREGSLACQANSELAFRGSRLGQASDFLVIGLLFPGSRQRALATLPRKKPRNARPPRSRAARVVSSAPHSHQPSGSSTAPYSPSPARARGFSYNLMVTSELQLPLRCQRRRRPPPRCVESKQSRKTLCRGAKGPAGRSPRLSSPGAHAPDT
jgi:hypothetical protein